MTRVELSAEKLRIGYVLADFPVLSETFVANDVRGMEALGHEVVVFSLGKPDPATANNPDYQIKGKIVRIAGLWPPVWRKVKKLMARRRLFRHMGEPFRAAYTVRPKPMSDVLWGDRNTWDAAIEQIAAEKPDLLYVHFGMRQLLLGFWASRLLNIPLAVTLHAHDIFMNPLREQFPLLLGQCSFVVTVSDYTVLKFSDWPRPWGDPIFT